MTAYQRKIIVRRFARSSRLFQIGLITGFWLIGEGIVHLFDLPFPGAIVGLFIVLALLISKRLSLHMVRQGSRWFLAEMLLFFIPAVAAISNYPEFLGILGIKILIVITSSTLAVMVVTALVIDFCWRWRVFRRKI